jgi:hypothetical protein
MKIFFSGSQSAADMAFRFIYIQYFPDFRRQTRIDPQKTLGDVFMYGRH